MKESILILTHRNADLDGFASSVLLYYYLRFFKNKENVLLAIPEGPSRPTVEFLTKANIKLDYVEYIENLSRLEDELIKSVILLDTSSIAQVGEFSRLVIDAECLVVIDHHAIQKFDTRGTVYYLVDQGATSTCEVLLANIEEEFLSELRPELATLAIGAVLVDSKRLTRATPRTFLLLAKLLERAHMRFDQINQTLFQREMPFDEKMARIKGMLRTEAYRYDNSIICVSHVSAHEASLARLLLEAGCDIVIIVSEHDDEFRIIARTKLENVSMAELCRRLAERYGGSGGGHTKAGAASIKESEQVKLTIRKLMRESVNLLSEIIGKKVRRVKP